MKTKIVIIASVLLFLYKLNRKLKRSSDYSKGVDLLLSLEFNYYYFRNELLSLILFPASFLFRIKVKNKSEWKLSDLVKSWNKSSFPLLSRVISKLNKNAIKFTQHSTNDLINYTVITNGAVTYNRILFHVHGGGFIAMNPKCHFDYLNEWIELFDCLIVSVDYKKSPQHKYPTALNECVSLYKQLLNNELQNIQANNVPIMLAGDSAGGNLATSLLVFIIENDITLPNALILTYPLLEFNVNMWTTYRDKILGLSSRIFNVNDPILSPHSLVTMASVYLPYSADPFDPHLSPLHVSSDILALFPPTYLLVGENDPFFDDSFLLYKRLKECHGPFYVNNGNLVLHVVDGWSHAFLHMGAVLDLEPIFSRVGDWVRRVAVNKLQNPDSEPAPELERKGIVNETKLIEKVLRVHDDEEKWLKSIANRVRRVQERVQ